MGPRINQVLFSERNEEMDLPMRADLKAGNQFPNFELPDHTGTLRKLSQLLHGFPGVLIFSRGYFCPRDRRQHTNYVAQLQPELRVNYCKMITVSVDDRLTSNEVRNALAGFFTNWRWSTRRILFTVKSTSLTHLSSIVIELFIRYITAGGISVDPLLKR